MIGWLGVAVASTAWAAPAAAPAAENVARLDAYLAGLVPFGFSGAVLVARDDQILLEKGYGRADDAAARDVTAATVFDVCSFTKQFTAAAILALEEQGKLRTEDPLLRHLVGVPSDKSAITLHHLLTHSAGIDDPPAEDYERAERDDYVRRVLASPLLWKPGSRYAYSNGGYSLLGALVEILSGQSYEQFLDARFFKPLGMSKTGYRRSRWTAGEVAHGYADGREFGSPLDHPGPYREAEPGRWPGPYWALATNGGVLSTVGELYRWSRALDGDKTLGAAARQKLFRPAVLAEEWGNETHYAYGWNVTRTPRGTTLIHHTGSSGTGFNAWVLRYVDEHATVVLLSNRIVEGVRLTRGIHEAVDRILFVSAPASPPSASHRLTGDDAARVAGLYRLPSGETFLVEASEPGLLVSGRGDRAIVALAFGGQGEADAHRGEQARIDAIFRGLESGDLSSYRTALWSERRFDEEEARLRPWWARLARARGALRRCQVLGSGPHEFLRQIYVELSFERGANLRVLVERNASGQLAVRTDADAARLPEVYRFLPRSADAFESFSLRLASGTRIRFALDSRGPARALRVTTAGGDLVAASER